MTPVESVVALLGGVLILMVSLFVAVPLFQHAAAAGPGVDSGRERLERQKRQALAAIKEAEEDQRMGKLSDEDLGALRARLETQALDAMAALEAMSGRRKR